MGFYVIHTLYAKCDMGNPRLRARPHTVHLGKIDDPDEYNQYHNGIDLLEQLEWSAFWITEWDRDPYALKTFCPKHKILRENYIQKDCAHRYVERGADLVCERCGKIR